MIHPPLPLPLELPYLQYPRLCCDSLVVKCIIESIFLKRLLGQGLTFKEEIWSLLRSLVPNLVFTIFQSLTLSQRFYDPKFNPFSKIKKVVVTFTTEVKLLGCTSQLKNSI
jgi:hypothetical protein